MPAYIFRLPSNGALRAVTIYDNTNGVRGAQVAAGTLDSNATITKTLNVGDYVAQVRVGSYLFESTEEPAVPVTDELIVKQNKRAFDVADFGAKCDGGASQTGTLASTAIVTDPTPPTVLPVAGQGATWAGFAAAVGGGITAVSMSASGQPIAVTTATAHGLTTGQQVLIAGVGGATQANGLTTVTVTGSTGFTIPYNLAQLGTYTSGGTVAPRLVLFGYVSNPVVATGTLTFKIVTTAGGSTAVTVPASAGTTGNYYFGTDDIAAWNAAITAAKAVASPAAFSRITWSGTSMVSATIQAQGPILFVGDTTDYTNPMGTGDASSLPLRGSIVRPHGNFANPTTTPLLNCGSVLGTRSDIAGTSTEYGVWDAANIARSAIRASGSRNFFRWTYALNGTRCAWDWATASNAVATECIGGQSQTGDALFVGTGGDCKWKGGYLREAVNGVHAVGSSDFYIGNGAHIFNGYNGGNNIPGTDILIETSATDTAVFDTTINGVVFDGCLGPHIRFYAAANGSIQNTNITGNQFFNQYQGGAFVDVVHPVLQVDASGATSTVSGLLFDGWTARGPQASNRYKSVIDLIGNGSNNLSGLVLGTGHAANTQWHWTTAGGASRPSQVAPSSVQPFSATWRHSARDAFASATGDGTTTQFVIGHFCSAQPAAVSVIPQNATTPKPDYVTLDGTNVTIRYATAPTNGASLGWHIMARI